MNVGPEPVCPYGYFDYAPYNCAPYGYYGPTWFANGIFIGAGPWFHGPHGFHGMSIIAMIRITATMADIRPAASMENSRLQSWS